MNENQSVDFTEAPSLGSNWQWAYISWSKPTITWINDDPVYWRINLSQRTWISFHDMFKLLDIRQFFSN